MAVRPVIVGAKGVTDTSGDTVVVYDAGQYERGQAGAAVPERVATAVVQVTGPTQAYITQTFSRVEVSHG